MQRTFAKSLLAAGAVVGLSFAAWTVASPAAVSNADDSDTLKVGVFEQDMAFHQYRGTQQFMQQTQELERQFAEAQQAQDQERIIEIQNEYQRLQQRLHQQFERDLEAASERLAREHDIKLIVAEVIYHADNVEEVDLTEPMVETANRMFDESQRD